MRERERESFKLEVQVLLTMRQQGGRKERKKKERKANSMRNKQNQ